MNVHTGTDDRHAYDEQMNLDYVVELANSGVELLDECFEQAAVADSRCHYVGRCVDIHRGVLSAMPSSK
jgi:hypothetical protein